MIVKRPEVAGRAIFFPGCRSFCVLRLSLLLKNTARKALPKAIGACFLFPATGFGRNDSFWASHKAAGCIFATPRERPYSTVFLLCYYICPRIEQIHPFIWQCLSMTYLQQGNAIKYFDMLQSEKKCLGKFTSIGTLAKVSRLLLFRHGFFRR